MKAAFPYTRVPGRRRGTILSSTVWMGDDHLLLVRNSRFSETYKRFFYRDIEALLIRRGPRFSVSPYWLLTFVALLFGMLIAIPSRSRTGIWMIVAGLIAMMVYLAVECLFLSCTTSIQTAVSSEELNALFRTRHALKAARLIATKIEEFQGPAERLAFERPAQPLPPLPAAAPHIDAPPSRTALALTLASFLFLLVDAAFTYYSGTGQVTSKITAITSILILAEATLLLSALVALWPGNSARSLRNLIIAALVFSGLAYYAGSMVAQIRTAVVQANIRASEPFFANTRAVINLLDEIGNIVLGVSGLIAWKRSAKP